MISPCSSSAPGRLRRQLGLMILAASLDSARENVGDQIQVGQSLAARVLNQ